MSETEHQAHGHTTVETVKTHISTDATVHKVQVDASGSLLEILLAGANAAGQSVLPHQGTPLDRLHGIDHHGAAGAALPLDEGIAQYLQQPGATKDFEIELVLAIRVNARWAIATSEQMTPQEILQLPGIHLDPANHQLYPHNGKDPLPADVPVKLRRGEHFEAQRGGKYGGT